MSQPNILIVMTDHQRGDTVLPEHGAVTPNVTKLAGEGVTFTNAFCPSPHCCPARATFFTGLYPSRHGVWNNICNDQAIARTTKPGATFWSEDLKKANYDMHFVGKWHVSTEKNPGDVGWREDFVSGTGKDFHGITWERYQQIAQQPRAGARGEGEILRPGYPSPFRLYGTQASKPEQHDEKVFATAMEALGKTSGKNPWAMYVGFIGPHDPYLVPGEFLDRYKLEDIELPASFSDSLADKPRIYQRMRNQVFGQLSPREVKEAIRHYWAYCSYLDHRFGELLKVLDASGQGENTMVLYCADHGDYAGDHGLFAKGIPCFRGAYHVPAVMRWPGGIKGVNRREGAFVSLADFGPTFLEAAGVSYEGGRFTGQSLMPFLRNQAPVTWRDEIHTQCNGVELYYTQRSVTTAQYKYVFNGFDFDELYDLQNDPHEMRNLAENPAYQDVKRNMCQRMWRFAKQQNDSAINPYITVGLAPYGPAEGLLPM